MFLRLDQQQITRLGHAAADDEAAGVQDRGQVSEARASQAPMISKTAPRRCHLRVPPA